MTIDHRMSRCRESLAHSIASMQRSCREMESAYATIARENRRLADNTAALGVTVKSIEANLRRYDDELSGVHAGICELGDKSRRLASIMDDYLAGRFPGRARRVA